VFFYQPDANDLAFSINCPVLHRVGPFLEVRDDQRQAAQRSWAGWWVTFSKQTGGSLHRRGRQRHDRHRGCAWNYTLPSTPSPNGVSSARDRTRRLVRPAHRALPARRGRGSLRQGDGKRVRFRAVL